MVDNRIPVSVITGFLGSGKTTLVNHILHENHGKKIAIIENEYGEIGIDDGLVMDTKEELYEMNNGCVCCTVRGDLIRILNRLIKRKSKLDAILIETTGLADPAPVAQTFFVDEDLKESLRLDAIICVVDAKHVVQHLDEVKPDDVVNEAIQQVAFADKILLNKIDLVNAEEKADVIERITAINRAAKVIECSQANVPLDEILAQHAFDLDRIMAADPSFLQLEGDDNGGKEEKKDSHGHDHHHHHHHDEGEDEECKQCAAGDTEHKHEHEHEHHHHHEHADGEDCAECGTGAHGHKHKHKHDTRVSSVGIVLEGALDLRKLNVWLSDLLQERGQDLYRCKGILNVAGTDDKFVFHGVHMMLQFASSADGTGKPWGPGEARVSKAVFIGKDLDRMGLNEGFKSCVVAE